MRASSNLVAVLVVTAALLPTWARGQQVPDESFDARVEHPAYPGRSPRVVIDEAHANFHPAEGRYKPFADLLSSDGYDVVRGTTPFSMESLAGVDVLVISNALGSDVASGQALPGRSSPAFTDGEADALLNVVHWLSRAL